MEHANSFYTLCSLFEKVAGILVDLLRTLIPNKAYIGLYMCKFANCLYAINSYCDSYVYCYFTVLKDAYKDTLPI